MAEEKKLDDPNAGISEVVDTTLTIVQAKLKEISQHKHKMAAIMAAHAQARLGIESYRARHGERRLDHSARQVIRDKEKDANSEISKEANERLRELLKSSVERLKAAIELLESLKIKHSQGEVNQDLGEVIYLLQINLEYFESVLSYEEFDKLNKQGEREEQPVFFISLYLRLESSVNICLNMAPLSHR